MFGYVFCFQFVTLCKDTGFRSHCALVGKIKDLWERTQTSVQPLPQTINLAHLLPDKPVESLNTIDFCFNR